MPNPYGDWSQFLDSFGTEGLIMKCGTCGHIEKSTPADRKCKEILGKDFTFWCTPCLKKRRAA